DFAIEAAAHPFLCIRRGRALVTTTHHESQDESDSHGRGLYTRHRVRRSIYYMRVLAVPCLKDNFAYLVVDDGGAAVVDPGEVEPVAQALAREGIALAAIWLTHHHWDHVGGVEGLVAAHPGLEVVAHASDQGRAPKVTRWVNEGDVVELGAIRA